MAGGEWCCLDNLDAHDQKRGAATLPLRREYIHYSLMTVLFFVYYIIMCAWARRHASASHPTAWLLDSAALLHGRTRAVNTDAHGQQNQGEERYCIDVKTMHPRGARYAGRR